MHMFQENLSSLMENRYFTVNKLPKQPRYMIKGQWTAEEDQLLVRLVHQYGLKRWSHIARMLVGRVGKQCRERWYNHLRPDIKKEAWTQAEDMALVEAHAAIGNKWAEIAKRIPGRPENSIKNHWNATWRKLLSKRKCRKAGMTRTIGEEPRSVLQHYIRRKVLAMEKGIEEPKTMNQEHFVLNNSSKEMESRGQEGKENYVPNAIVPASTNGDMDGGNETSGSIYIAYDYGLNYSDYLAMLIKLLGYCPNSSSYTMETIDDYPIEELPTEFNTEDLMDLVSRVEVKVDVEW